MKFSQLKPGVFLGYGSEVISYNHALKLISEQNLQHSLRLIKEGEFSKILNQLCQDTKNIIEKDFYELEVGSEVEIDIDHIQAKVRRLIMVPTGGYI